MSLNEPPRIAVIGAGICGATSALYLKERFPEVNVTVFERSLEVGGRTKSMGLKEQRVNVGAGFFIKANLNVMELINRFEVPYQPALKDKHKLVAWDGSAVWFNSSQWSSWFSLFWFYGPSIWKLYRVLGARLKQFMTIYPKLDPKEPTGFSLDTPGQFLEAVGNRADLQQTAAAFCRQIGLSKRFVDVFLYGMAKGIYNNNINRMNAFAMLITLEGMAQKAFTPTNGTDSIVKAMLAKDNDFCTVKTSTIVSQIVYNPREKTFKLFSNNLKDLGAFEVVVIAAPFQGADLTFTGVELPKELEVTKNARKVTVTILEGLINNQFFGISNARKPTESLIFMQGSEGPTHGLNSLEEVKQLPNGLFAYRLESEDLVPDELLAKMFRNYKKVFTQVWDFAYPDLKPLEPDTLPPFRLAPGLYFPSAIEFAASCMELQAISARNLVKLVSKHEGKDWRTAQ